MLPGLSRSTKAAGVVVFLRMPAEIPSHFDRSPNSALTNRIEREGESSGPHPWETEQVHQLNVDLFNGTRAWNGCRVHPSFIHFTITQHVLHLQHAVLLKL